MEKSNQDGWYTYQTNDHTQGFFGQLALELETLEPHELQHEDYKHMVLKSLVETLLATRPTYDYYFCECYDTPAPADIPEGGWQTLYNTAPLYGKKGNLWPYTYDTIDYVSGEQGLTDGYAYFALSRNGCWAASALTEYIRVNT